MPSNSELGAMEEGETFELKPSYVNLSVVDRLFNDGDWMKGNGMLSMRMRVAVEPGAFMPMRAHRTDAAVDLFATCDGVVNPHGRALFDTGVHFDFPEGWCGLLVSRSGLNVNHGITSTGLIDPDYTGAVGVILHNHSDRPYQVSKGDRIGQMVILPFLSPEFEYVNVEELEETERGAGGFGSTGR